MDERGGLTLHAADVDYARLSSGAMPFPPSAARLAFVVVSAMGWVSNVARAACDVPSTVIDVIEAAEVSADAYGNADLMGFIETTSRLEALLPCLQEPVPRNVAASVHRMMGIRAFVDKKKDRAEAAFGAARAIEPRYRFPETMVPPGHPMMSSYGALALESLTTVEVPTPAGGYLHLDGRPTTDRPVEHATLVQRFEGDGSVGATAYLWPSDAMIEYRPGEPVAPVGPVPAAPPALPTAVRRGPNLPMLIGAGGSAVAATVLYGLGASSASAFRDPAAPYEDGTRLRARTNTLAIASGGAGVVALGLGVGAVVAGRW